MGPSPDGSSTGTINIRASDTSCRRTAFSNVNWISISFGTPGTGNGSVGYVVKANLTPFARTGTITVAGFIFTVFQAANQCEYTLAPSRTRFAASGGTASISIETRCEWTATADVPWIRITGSASGVRNGSTGFEVSANTAAVERTGRIQIGTKSILITQEGADCQISLSPASAEAAAAGGQGSFQVQSPFGCAWTAAAVEAWIQIVRSDAATGMVTYRVLENRTPVVRGGSIRVGELQFRLTQAAATCPFEISPRSAAWPAAGGRGNIQITTTCDWTAASTINWITVSPGSGSGNGSLSYVVAANPSGQPRSGSLSIGNLRFTVTQEGASCRFLLQPATASFPDTGGAGSVQVSGQQGCDWDAASESPWITISGVNRSATGGTVFYNVAANDGEARQAVLRIAQQDHVVRQSAASPRIAAGGVVNAASFLAGPLSPGLIVTLFGTRLGPAALTTLQLTGEGRFIRTELAGTRVLFDGVAAPLVYASSGQTSAVVPYAVAGKSTTQIEVEFEGRRSEAVTIAVAPAAPGIFTISSQGSGPGAILNQDFSVNLPANPAAAGSVVQIFATGEGQTEPPGVDGRLALEVLARPVEPVKVEIGGRLAEVTYAGSAPGLIAGVIQVNAVIPPQLPPGEHAVVLIVGGRRSQSGVTVSVR